MWNTNYMVLYKKTGGGSEQFVHGTSLLWGPTLYYVRSHTVLCEVPHCTVWGPTLHCVRYHSALCEVPQHLVWGTTAPCVRYHTSVFRPVCNDLYSAWIKSSQERLFITHLVYLGISWCSLVCGDNTCVSLMCALRIPFHYFDVGIHSWSPILHLSIAVES